MPWVKSSTGQKTRDTERHTHTAHTDEEGENTYAHAGREGETGQQLRKTYIVHVIQAEELLHLLDVQRAAAVLVRLQEMLAQRVVHGHRQVVLLQ